MSTPFSSIENHQRILITGPRKKEIFDQCKKVLDHHKKDFAFINENGELVGSSGSMVMIISAGELKEFQPHIALMDEVSDDEYNSYFSLADIIPKSGTLVFNTDDPNTQKICDTDRTDVHKETYTGSPADAARALLRRIGINDQRFDAALA